MKRRNLMKCSLATGIAAIASGLLTPGKVMAAYPKAAFGSEDLEIGLSNAFGISKPAESSNITIKAPTIAENGAVVPIQISTDLNEVKSISILVENNLKPFVASFRMHGSAAYVSTRIKMKKTSNVIAVVKAGGALFSTSKEIKVTDSGCEV